MGNIDPFVFVHVLAGGIALLSGAAALIARKGGLRHRQAGTAFFASMLVMAGFAAALAALGAQKLNTIAAVFTLYLVTTAWAVVRRRPGETGRFETVALAVALSVAAAGLTLGAQAATSPTGLEDGDPSSGQAAGTYFAFGGLAALAAMLDLNFLLRKRPSRPQRLARHLWRMCLALFVASGSLFLGQQDVFPAALRGSPVMLVPALAPLVLMLFWLLRVRLTRRAASKPGALPAYPS